MSELLEWLQRSEGPLAYLVLGLASAAEYLVPPFPGDSIALFGVVMAAGAGYSVAGVYLALNLGALAGGMSAYGVGRWIEEKREHRTPRFMRGQQVRRAIDSAITRFERHGAAYLALNRFLPGLRSVFFVAAGMARLPPWKVAVWGTLSAMIWNALLLGAGWLVGANYAELERWVRNYTYAAVGVLVLVGVVVAARLAWARRSKKSPPGSA